jgi:hypothetical protein
LALARAFFAAGFLTATFFAARLTVFFLAMARNLHHVRVAGQRVVSRRLKCYRARIVAPFAM